MLQLYFEYRLAIRVLTPTWVSCTQAQVDFSAGMQIVSTCPAYIGTRTLVPGLHRGVEAGSIVQS